MRFETSFASDDQIAILRAFFREREIELPPKIPESFFKDFDNQDEKSAARLLRERLLAFGIRIKHTHALSLIGKLAGRKGWHTTKTTESHPQYKVVFSHIHAQNATEIEGDDPAKLLTTLASEVTGFACRKTLNRVSQLRRNPREIMILWESSGNMEFIGFIQLMSDSITLDWLNFCDRACERLRRIVEYQGNGFCNGFVQALQSTKEHTNVVISVLNEDMIEIGRGSELQVFNAIEKSLKKTFTEAKTTENRIEVYGRQFHLAIIQHAVEPRIHHETRTFLTPETQGLLHRYKELNKKLGRMISMTSVKDKITETEYGIPDFVPLNWKALKDIQSQRGISDTDVMELLLMDEASFTTIKTEYTVALGLFLQLAKYLSIEADEYNQLVTKPKWSTAIDVSSEPLLRTLLYIADKVNFVAYDTLNQAQRDTIKNAAEDLNASRNVRDLQRQGGINGSPLDHVVFSTDGADFLSAVLPHRILIRGSMLPFFSAAPGMAVPAIGRCLTLIMAPDPIEGGSHA